MKRILFAISLCIGLIFPATVFATDGPAIAHLVQTAFGVYRDYDWTLDTVAQREADRIRAQLYMEHIPLSDLTNAGWSYGDVQARYRYCGDILQCSVNGWVGSALHANILSNPAYTRIGCGHAGPDAEEWHYVVCVVGTPPGSPPGGGGNPPPAPGEVALPPFSIPDTGLDLEAIAYLTIWGLTFFVLVGLIVSSRRRNDS